METSTPVLEVRRSVDFTSDLLATLHEFKSRALFTDFAIRVGEVEIPCHSVIMAAASPYFRCLFDCSLVECAEKAVEVDLDPGYLQRVVDYCYSGHITIALDSAHRCLEIVEYFQLAGIKADIERFVREHLCPANCIGWFFHADKYAMHALKAEARNVMMARFTEVVRGREFLALTAEELVNYISHDIIAVADRGTILAACVRWMKEDVATRSEVILEVFPHVPLNRCSQSRLKHVLKGFDPWCPNYAQIQQTFVAAILDSIPDHVTIRNEKLSVLVLGGVMDHGVLNQSYWRLNLITGECEYLGELPKRVAKYGVAQTLISGGAGGERGAGARMFFGGGSQSLTARVPTQNCAVFVRDSGRWEELPDLLSPVEDATAVASDRAVIVVGGSDPRGNVIEELNLETREWRPLSRLVQKASSPLVALSGGCVYIIMNNASPLLAMAMQCYDIAAGTWQLRKLPEELQVTTGACMVTLRDGGDGDGEEGEGDLFVVGGTERLCQRYRRAQDVWVPCARPIHVHSYGAAVAVPWGGGGVSGNGGGVSGNGGGVSGNGGGVSGNGGGVSGNGGGVSGNVGGVSGNGGGVSGNGGGVNGNGGGVSGNGGGVSGNGGGVSGNGGGVSGFGGGVNGNGGGVRGGVCDRGGGAWITRGKGRGVDWSTGGGVPSPADGCPGARSPVEEDRSSGGQIILCGGWDESGHCQRTVEVYDVRDDKWAVSERRGGEEGGGE